jgi:lysophospholipase L1-like esterase
MKRRRSIKIIITTLVVLIVAELGLRLAGWAYLNRYYSGLSDSKPNHIHILCLGESSTLGLWVRREDTYPMQLQERLRRYYHNDEIHVIVAPHVGQNSSQMANRIDDYVAQYRPRLVIAMAGVNNEWSLSESHLGRFLPGTQLELRSLIALDGLRLFRVARYLYLRVTTGHTANQEYSILGHPSLASWPPPRWRHDFALRHPSAFAQMWQYDMRLMIEGARKGGAEFLVMTYHLPPEFLNSADYTELAAHEHVRLVRNDLSFLPLITVGTIDQYVFGDDHWHPNRRGYSIIAENAFEAIVSNNLLQLFDGAPQVRAIEQNPQP